MRVLLVDGNNIANRARFALKNLSTQDGRRSGAVFGFMQSLNYCRNMLGVEAFNIYICWDYGRAAWRQELYPEYKQNRKPPANQEVDEHQEFYDQMNALQKNLTSVGCRNIRVEGVEADDLISIYSRKLSIDNDVFILSGDQDMHQLCSSNISIFDPVKGKLDSSGITTRWMVEISQIPLTKALMGDSSDNISGVPKMGPVRAVDFIQQSGGDLYFQGEFKGKNKKVLESVRTDEGRTIVERNLKLMRLPVSWGEVPYSVPQQIIGDAQFLTPPKTNRMEFVQFLRHWELMSILEHAGTW